MLAVSIWINMIMKHSETIIWVEAVGRGAWLFHWLEEGEAK